MSIFVQCPENYSYANNDVSCDRDGTHIWPMKGKIGDTITISAIGIIRGHPVRQPVYCKIMGLVKWNQPHAGESVNVMCEPINTTEAMDTWQYWRHIILDDGFEFLEEG